MARSRLLGPVNLDVGPLPRTVIQVSADRVLFNQQASEGSSTR